MTRTDVDHYEGLVYWGPMSSEQMEDILDRVDLSSNDRALDVGCGRAEVLVRLVERFDVEATGVDRSAAALALARSILQARCPEARPQLLETDVNELRFDRGTFRWISWLGGPFIGASFESTVAALKEWLTPGGYLLLGHGFWAQQPPAAYLKATSLPEDALSTHEHNLEVIREADLELLATSISTREAWDHFEGTIHANHEAYAAAHPDDEDLQAMIATKRAWHDAQERWGRDVMGFALYTARRL